MSKEFSNKEVLKYLSSLSVSERKEMISAMIKSGYGSKLRQEVEKVLYFYPPPSPQEFLDPRYQFLSEQFVSGMYQYVKDDFVEAMSNTHIYDGYTLYGGTRTGKSYLTRLCVVYTMLRLSYMRSPHLYYNISTASLLAMYAVSFKDDKIYELLIDPIEKILEQSPRFKKEKFKDQVKMKGVSQDGIIHYSSASNYAAFTFPSFNVVTGRDPSEFVGADIIAAVASELTWYSKYVPGFNNEDVIQVYSKLRSRIIGTIGKGHDVGNWIILDGSAFEAESPLEKMILEQHANDPKIFFRRYATPHIRPHLYPQWNLNPNDPNNYFEVVTGNADFPAQIVDKDPIKRAIQIKDIPEKLIEKAPIDMYTEFARNIVDSIRDILGFPTSSESRLIQKASFITNVFDNPTLDNLISNIQVDSSIDDPNYLFNALKKFFIEINDKSYYFKRARKEPRWIGFDLAESVKGDVSGLCVLHKEKSRITGKTMYVTDFAFAISPGVSGISLKAIPDLILFMNRYCNTLIKNIAVDTFQSKFAVQLLQDINNLPVEGHSTVKDLQCWITLSTLLANGTYKAGRNIYIKNNFQSLKRIKNKNDAERIDHDNGKKVDTYTGEWETSECGKNANDVADGIVQALFVAEKDPYTPITCYEDENDQASKLYTGNEIQNHFTQDDIGAMAKLLQRKY